MGQFGIYDQIMFQLHDVQPIIPEDFGGNVPYYQFAAEQSFYKVGNLPGNVPVIIGLFNSAISQSMHMK